MMRFASYMLLACCTVTPLLAVDKYKLGADSQRKELNPQGEVTKHVWKSTVYAGTIREYHVYVPKQYKSEQPAAVMVFQDGHTYVDDRGQFRATVVMDNLIAAKKMPVTIGLFINPGHKGEELPKEPWKANNRSVEYDTLSDQYAKFLMDEMLPEVGKTYSLTADPEMRAVCGISSGGICAMTVGWERPDAFRKVMSHIGSFTDIRGGHVYPALIRKAEPKPLRVYLQANEFDLDNQFGNWYLANLQMESTLKFKKYDHKLVVGKGDHGGEFGGSVFPAGMAWLWRKE